MLADFYFYLPTTNNCPRRSLDHTGAEDLVTRCVSFCGYSGLSYRVSESAPSTGSGIGFLDKESNPSIAMRVGEKREILIINML